MDKRLMRSRQALSSNRGNASKTKSGTAAEATTVLPKMHVTDRGVEAADMDASRLFAAALAEALLSFRRCNPEPSRQCQTRHLRKGSESKVRSMSAEATNIGNVHCQHSRPLYCDDVSLGLSFMVIEILKDQERLRGRPLIGRLN